MGIVKIDINGNKIWQNTDPIVVSTTIDKIVLRENGNILASHIASTGSKGILEFSPNGDFIGAISNKYIKINDFLVDEYYIYLLDKDYKQVVQINKNNSVETYTSVYNEPIAISCSEDNIFVKDSKYLIKYTKKLSKLLQTLDYEGFCYGMIFCNGYIYTSDINKIFRKISSENLGKIWETRLDLRCDYIQIIGDKLMIGYSLSSNNGMYCFDFYGEKIKQTVFSYDGNFLSLSKYNKNTLYAVMSQDIVEIKENVIVKIIK